MEVEYPAAKRVRRSDLRSLSTSPTLSSSAYPEDALRAHYSKQVEAIFSFPSLEAAKYPIQPPDNTDKPHDVASPYTENEDQPEAFTFRLLAPNPAKQSSYQHVPAQKILLRSPTPPNREPGLLRPQHRPLSYYFTADTPSVSKRKQEYAAIAIEGDHVRREAQQPWPGASLPWRVTNLPASSADNRRLRKHTKSGNNSLQKPLSETATKKKRRHGKKRRIVIRMRHAAEKEKAARKQIEEKERESKWEEKKKSENRKKKLRRREKEKAKKKAGEVRAVV